MLFHDLAEYFVQLREMSSRTEMIKCLATLLDKASAHESAIITYLVLGELRPPYESTRFNIAEKSLVKIVARTLELSDSEIRQLMTIKGDMGDVVAQGKWHGSQQHELTILQMHKLLQHIESISGVGSQETRLEEVAHILRSISPLEAALVIRIIHGSLRLGFSDMTVIDAISWMLVGNKSAHALIERSYNICADIGRIMYCAKEGGEKAIEAVHMQVGIPIRPAAAERLPTAQAIIEKLGSCIVQPKFDGFRLQLHVKRVQGRVHVEFFSRNLHRLEGMFPEFEQAFLGWHGENCILEGEAISYQESTGEFLPFQETVKRRRKHKIADTAQEFPLKLVLFDILYYHGESIIELPHHERYKLLHKVADSLANTAISVVKETTVSTEEELEACFYEAVEHGLEGLVIKRDNASYQAGKRNFNWIKLKRQEVGFLEDTIDAVVLGYYSGRGKRAQFGIGAFLIGVYDKKRDQFETLAKIGTGLSDEEWKQLKKWCDQRAINHKPVNVACSPQLEPHVWVNPDLVVEVEADEITKSPVHTAGKTVKTPYGLALRFPRLVKIRDDKSASDATTVDEVVSMYKNQRLDNSERPAKRRK